VYPVQLMGGRSYQVLYYNHMGDNFLSMFACKLQTFIKFLVLI
jgi:hypothetical protein